jgi:hypothetical protein
MPRTFYGLLFASLVLGPAASTKAQDIIVPAGTLLHCTLDEPNFSSATANVGDPVVCLLSNAEEFGDIVFPRGSYLAGHLESYKEPGHFVGKGYLKLEFDRLALPSGNIPVPGKIVAVAGYRVNRRGDIVGHGHAKRDTVEWFLPPLWPLKVLTLPARGPRPTLRGEEQITLRLMDDIEMPGKVIAARSSDKPPYAYEPRSSNTVASFDSTTPNKPREFTKHVIGYLPPVAPAMETQSDVAISVLADSTPEESDPISERVRQDLTFIALKSGTIFTVVGYRIDGAQLIYVRPSGLRGALEVSKVDWAKTSQLNAEQ